VHFSQKGGNDSAAATTGCVPFRQSRQEKLSSFLDKHFIFYWIFASNAVTLSNKSEQTPVPRTGGRHSVFFHITTERIVL
jgi:hypothetical protein